MDKTRCHGKSRKSNKKARPIPQAQGQNNPNDQDIKLHINNTLKINSETHIDEPVNREKSNNELRNLEQDKSLELFESGMKRFIEISKYFTNPLQKTASYICESCLVSYPNPYKIEFKRGGVTTQYLKFSNLILEPVYIKLFKLVPELEQLKFINIDLSRCKRIPPGLSCKLCFIYNDVNEKPARDAKMIFVANRKTSTPCYQVCEIDFLIKALNVKLVTV